MQYIINNNNNDFKNNINEALKFVQWIKNNKINDLIEQEYIFEPYIIEKILESDPHYAKTLGDNIWDLYEKYEEELNEKIDEIDPNPTSYSEDFFYKLKKNFINEGLEVVVNDINNNIKIINILEQYNDINYFKQWVYKNTKIQL